MAGSGNEVVIQDADVAVVVENSDCAAWSARTVGDAVVVDGRHVGAEEQNCPAVPVERVRGDVEVGDAVRGSDFRVAYVDAGVIVADKCILKDQHVLHRSPAHILVGVDSGAGGGPGLVVVLDLVVLDEHLRTAAVGEPDADDVVLDDIVQDLRSGGPGPHRDAVAREGDVRTVLEGEPVDDDVVRRDVRALRVGHA